VPQERSNSPLARALRAARRHANLSQGKLAALAGVSPRSCWHAEQGRGHATSYERLAAALGMEITGRSLPPGQHLGDRLRVLRLRQGASVREVAERAGLSVNTIGAVERGEPGHLSTVERVAQVLGAGLTLVRRGEALAFFASAAVSSARETWTTPPEFLERLYRALGGHFDVDPCSPGALLSPVRAATHFTRADDGLAQDWHGRVYMNPPYGRGIGRWTSKARLEVASGRASLVIGLVGVCTGTRWWHGDVAGHADLWMLRGRLRFGDGSAPAPFSSVVVAWGASVAVVRAISAEFPDAQHVPSHRTAASLAAPTTAAA
jgi:transcriptional regulator with XRE-family HTH domain